MLSVFGTRPGAIKMAPVVRALAACPEVSSHVCVTGQHRELLDEVLGTFGIAPEYDLDVMRPGQSPAGVASEVLRGLEPVLANVRPDWVTVLGDTTTAAIGALAAFYAGARVAHVEAGLRTYVAREPFPEEINRRVAGVVADLHLAPTRAARDNLVAEGVAPEAVLVTGNTVIDALHAARTLPSAGGTLDLLPRDQRLVVVTAHRRESFGPALERICSAVAELVARFEDVHVALPVHPNPAVRIAVEERLGGLPGVSLLAPLGYRDMVELLERASIVMTDSGGLQEEAPALGKPVLVLRDVTERPEGVAAGTARLVGTETSRIVEQASALLGSPHEYARMARAINPYGDGRAAERIVAALRGLPVTEFATGPSATYSPRPALRSLG